MTKKQLISKLEDVYTKWRAGEFTKAYEVINILKTIITEAKKEPSKKPKKEILWLNAGDDCNRCERSQLIGGYCSRCKR